MQVLRIPSGAALPADCQPAWDRARRRDIPGVPADAIVRLPDGSPWPDGATDAQAPIVVTDAHRSAARRALEAELQSRDPLTRDLAAADLADLDGVVRHARGMPHPYAYLAPPEIDSAEAACWAMTRALDRWDSRCSSAVIRTAMPSGFDVWIGVGGTMGSRDGRAETVQQAEQLAVAAVRQARIDSGLAEALSGWSAETPVFTSTLGAFVDELPIQIRRGPHTAGELAREWIGEVPVGGSSWDLPVVAVYRGDGLLLERHDDRVTWDDERSRERQRERSRKGERRRAAEVRWCLERLGEHPALAPLCGRRELRRSEVRLLGGGTVRTVGPVGARFDGRVPLALVEVVAERGHPRGRRMWMALGEFAAA